MAVFGRVGKDRDISVWVEAAGDAGAAWALDTQTLGADGDAAIGADFGAGALAPDIEPPRAFGSGAEGGAVFLFCARFHAACGVERSSRWRSFWWW